VHRNLMIFSEQELATFGWRKAGRIFFQAPGFLFEPRFERGERNLKRVAKLSCYALGL
jgi:hypothetical protein